MSYSTNNSTDPLFGIFDSVGKIEITLTKKSKEFEEELAKSHQLANERDVELAQSDQTVTEKRKIINKTCQSLTERENVC